MHRRDKVKTDVDNHDCGSRYCPMNLAWGFPLWCEDDTDSFADYEGLTPRARDMLAPPGGARHHTLAREVIERRNREGIATGRQPQHRQRL